MNGNADTFFGFPLDELTTENPRVLRYLIRAWIAEHGTEPTDFDEDLEKLRPLFHSHVTGNRVRDRVKTLDRIPQSRPYIPDVFFLPIDSERGLVTPEGRALIETTRDNNSDPSPADAVAAVARFYGDSLRAWMAKSVETGLVPLPSVGFVIFLLINGSVGPERAMRFPSKQDEEAESRSCRDGRGKHIQQLRPWPRDQDKRARTVAHQLGGQPGRPAPGQEAHS